MTTTDLEHLLRELAPQVLGTLRWQDRHGTPYVQASGDNSDDTAMLLFQPVTERKQVKNRVHLDIRATGPLYAEVARLVALGAAVVADDPDLSWVVLHDPEGNEFCVFPPEDQEA